MWPFYAALTAGAVVVSWRSYELRPVGLALAASWACSNLATMFIAVSERPAAYTVCEVMVLSMAFLAHVCGASRVMVAIVAVSILSIGLNIVMTTVDAPTASRVLSWQISTNLCFAAECLLTLSAGLYDRWSSRTRARCTDGGGSPAFHGRTAHSSEARR